MKTIIYGVLTVVLLSALHSKSLFAQDASILNKAKAVAVLESIENGDKRAIAFINPSEYIQHNLAVADGLAGFADVLQALPKGSAKVNVVRSFQDGNYIFTHTDYNFFGPKVGFDIFRFADGKIVEHWDNLTSKAQTLNPSGRSQLDGPTKSKDLDKTLENKALVADFINTVLIAGQFDKAPHYISLESYAQHNTQVADGLGGLSNAIDAMAKQGVFMVYSSNELILGEGNFVLAVSEGTFGGKAVSYYDLFRVSEGKIVEHWDVIEPILARENWKNTNGKFGFNHDYIVEVATFEIKENISPDTFAELDKIVEDTHVSKQPGFIRRMSELTEDNYWRVVVHWESVKDADNSMASFMQAPAAQGFMDALDASTMTMRRFNQAK